MKKTKKTSAGLTPTDALAYRQHRTIAKSEKVRYNKDMERQMRLAENL